MKHWKTLGKAEIVSSVAPVPEKAGMYILYLLASVRLLVRLRDRLVS